MSNKQIISEGQGPTPLKGQKVRFTVTLLKSATAQTKCEMKYPQSMVMGAGQLNPDIERALQSMKAGQKSSFVVPKYVNCFGVSQDQQLLMTIDLVEIGEVMTSTRYLTLEQREQRASVLKQQGNQLIKEKKYQECIDKYTSAYGLIEYENSQQSSELKGSLSLNLALAYINNKQYEKALEHCLKILKHNPLNSKAIYRKAQSLKQLGHFDRAAAIIKQVLEGDPENQEFQNLLKDLRQQEEATRKKEKQLYGRMFGDS